MTRGRSRPVLPPAPPADAAERLRALWAKDPAAARARAAGDPSTLAAVLAHAACLAADSGDAAAAEAFAAEADALGGAAPDARAAVHLAAADAFAAADPLGGAVEEHLLRAVAEATHPAVAGAALSRLALLYRDRSVPIGFRFYAPRALRFLDREGGTGLHPSADRDAARLCRAVLEYHHRRDEPERSGRAPQVLERVRGADHESTVHGLKYHGLALGRLKDWDGARRAFAEAARIAEEHDLRGCDGVFVYAAAVLAQEKDFAGARRLLGRVHIRRLEPEEKALFRQFRHLVEAAGEHRPLTGAKAARFLRAQQRKERAAAAAAAKPAVAKAPKAARAAASAKAGSKPARAKRPKATKRRKTP